jgi:hypothetical protein
VPERAIGCALNSCRCQNGSTGPGSTNAADPPSHRPAEGDTHIGTLQAWLPGEVALDRRGYVLTGPDAKPAGAWQLERDPYLLETSVPGIFACGDVRLSPVKRVAAAVGEGSMAIAFVHQYLRQAEAIAEPASLAPAAGAA